MFDVLQRSTRQNSKLDDTHLKLAAFVPSLFGILAFTLSTFLSYVAKTGLVLSHQKSIRVFVLEIFAVDVIADV